MPKATPSLNVTPSRINLHQGSPRGWMVACGRWLCPHSLSWVWRCARALWLGREAPGLDESGAAPGPRPWGTFSF